MEASSGLFDCIFALSLNDMSPRAIKEFELSDPVFLLDITA
jgi:hypothetical protein